jgi:hypothetical protein
MTDPGLEFSRDELQLLHAAMADLIDSFANAIEHGGSGDMIDRWRARGPFAKRWRLIWPRRSWARMERKGVAH